MCTDKYTAPGQTISKCIIFWHWISCDLFPFVTFGGGRDLLIMTLKMYHVV